MSTTICPNPTRTKNIAVPVITGIMFLTMSAVEFYQQAERRELCAKSAELRRQRAEEINAEYEAVVQQIRSGSLNADRAEANRLAMSSAMEDYRWALSNAEWMQGQVNLSHFFILIGVWNIAIGLRNRSLRANNPI